MEVETKEIKRRGQKMEVKRWRMEKGIVGGKTF
jgi:hypothetical protein